MLTEEKLDALRVNLELYQEILLPTTRSGDELFGNVGAKDHKMVTTATVKDKGSSNLEGARSGCKNTLWKNTETNDARFQQFSEKKSREYTMCSAVVLSAFGQEDNIFSICCSNGEFLLDFPKFTIATNLLASFADG